jgi:hypothetical protein
VKAEKLGSIRIAQSYLKRCKITAATLGVPMRKLVEQGLDLRFKELKRLLVSAGKVQG